MQRRSTAHDNVTTTRRRALHVATGGGQVIFLSAYLSWAAASVAFNSQPSLGFFDSRTGKSPSSQSHRGGS